MPCSRPGAQAQGRRFLSLERWKESGLTAEEFANELDIKVSTLRYWGYKLGERWPRSVRDELGRGGRHSWR